MPQPLPPILNPDDPLRPYTPPPKPRKVYSGKIWRWAKISGLTFLSLLSLLVIAAGLLEGKIGDLVIKEVNKELKTKLTVKEFHLSIIYNLPKAAAVMEDVTLQDALGGELVKAKYVALQFSLFSLFKDNITINSIVMRDATVLIKTDANGKVNYDIMKPSKTGESSKVSLSIEKARLERIKFGYIDAPSYQKADIYIKNGSVSGKFGAKQFTINSVADLNINHVTNKQQKFLINKPVHFDARIAVDLVKNIYQFDNLALDIASNPLLVKGLIQPVQQKGTFLNIIAQNKESSLSNLLQLLPPQYSAYFKDFESSGNLTFKTTIKGLISKTQNPDIQADIQFSNGRIASPKIKQPFEKVSFKAHFDSRKSVFDIQDCKGVFGGNPLTMQLQMVNMRDPSVNFSANGAVPLSMAFGLLNNSKISEGKGMVQFNNLKVVGRAKDMTSLNAFTNIQASGNLNLDNATLKINGEPLAADGVLNFNNNVITVQNFNIKGAESDVTFTGTFGNWLPVLLSDSTSNAELNINARLDAERLDIGRLMAINKPKVKQNIPKSYYYAAKGLPMPQYRKRLPLLNKMQGHFEMHVKEYIYDKIYGRNFKGDFDMVGNDLLLKGTTAAMGGSWLIDGKIELGYRPHLVTKLTTDRIDISEFFRQSNEFYQKNLTSQNVSGRLTSKMVVNSYWDDNLNFEKDKLHILADVNVVNGALNNVDILNDFATYIKVQDLRQIKFTTLQNYFEVHKQTLYIPNMFIQNNALNLQISGKHSFSQEIDYNLVVNAGQVLMSRFKKFNPRLEPQADQRNGLFNLYYNISGNVDNFKYSSDKESIRAIIAESDRYRNEIKMNLAKYFGLSIQNMPNMDMPTATTPKPVPPQYSPYQKPPVPVKNNKKEKDDVEYLPGF
jgi:AsmA-like C-terminal region